MSSLGSLPQAKVVFQQALQEVMRETEAQRGVILFGESAEEPKLRAAESFQERNFWVEAPLSLSLLKRVLRTGEPVAIQSVLNDPQSADNLSLTLTNVRSLVCAPLWGPGQQISGLIYADWTEQESPVDARRSLSRVQQVARGIERKLAQLVSGSGTEPEPEEPRPKKSAVYRPRVATRHKALTLSQQKVFLRNLAILFASGVPLVEGLNCLAQGADGLEEQRALRDLSARLQKGQTLSDALHETGLAGTLAERMVAVGERSGRLEVCLRRLADHAEATDRFRWQLRSRLLFPAFTLLFALFFCAIGPRLVLDSQMQMFAQLGVRYPGWLMPTVTALRWLGSPWLWAVLLALWWLPPWRAGLLRLLARLALKIPPLRRIWDSYQICFYCQALALALDAGVPASDAVQLSGRLMAEGSPFRRLHQRLHEGDALHEALRLEGLSPLLMEMVKVGEETGRLPEMLNWVANQGESNLSAEIDQFLGLIQPLLLMGLGLLTGTALLVTMLPTVKALEAL